jgi:hypothetical protein
MANFWRLVRLFPLLLIATAEILEIGLVFSDTSIDLPRFGESINKEVSLLQVQ